MRSGLITGNLIQTLNTLSDFPPLAIFRVDVVRGLSAVLHFQLLGIPVEFVAGAVGDISEEDGLGEGGGVSKVARRWCSRLTRADLFLMVGVRSGQVRDERRRWCEVLEFCFGQEHATAIIRD